MKFTGDYKGHPAEKGEYEIKAADISGASVVVPNMSYTKKGKYLQAPIVTIDNILLSSKDYEVKYSDFLTGEPLSDPIELSGSDMSKSIRVEVTGKGNLTGTCWEIYSIEKPDGRIDLTGAKITVVKSEEFSGEPVQPMVSVQVNGQTIPASKYHVGYANNKHNCRYRYAVLAEPCKPLWQDPVLCHRIKQTTECSRIADETGNDQCQQ